MVYRSLFSIAPNGWQYEMCRCRTFQIIDGEQKVIILNKKELEELERVIDAKFKA